MTSPAPAAMPSEEDVARIVKDAMLDNPSPATSNGSFNERYEKRREIAANAARAILAFLAPILAEKERLQRQVDGIERSLANQRERWRNADEHKYLDNIRRQIAGLRPGDAEAIADAQSGIVQSEQRADALEARALAAEAALAGERERCAARVLSQRYIPEDMRRQLSAAIRAGE